MLHLQELLLFSNLDISLSSFFFKLPFLILLDAVISLACERVISLAATVEAQALGFIWEYAISSLSTIRQIFVTPQSPTF